MDHARSETLATDLLVVVTDAVRALSRDRDAREVLHRGIGALVGAHSSAYARLDLATAPPPDPHGSMPPVVLGAGRPVSRVDTSFVRADRLRPDPPAADRVIDLSDGSARGGGAATGGRLALPVPWDRLRPLAPDDSAAVAWLPLAVTGREVAGYLFARRDQFPYDAAERLTRAQPPAVAIEVLLRRSALPTAVAPPGCPLTAREREVLALLGRGLLARTIAAQLSVSPRTVHHHLGSIYDKLGVNDRLAAVLLARETGLLPDGRG